MVRGKRVRHYTAQHLAAGRRKPPVAAEDRALGKLVICGIIFVLLVAVKLLFPETMDSLAKSAAQWIGGNADFKEAFAAMGRAVSGEETVEDSLQEAYTAVFDPSPLRTSVSEQEKRNFSEGETDSEVLLSQTLSPQDAGDASEKSEDYAANRIETETVTYSYVMPSLPENASLTQRNLGFPYTTPLYGTMTSSFGWREHPIEGGSRFHYGLDLAAEWGTDICAFADGEVFATGESSTLGQYIILSHANGYQTLYAHCSEVLKLSGPVSMGEVIARVGQTGAATGAHLHFELQDGTLYLNPIYYVDLG